MNEGLGLMIDVAIAYKNRAIKKQMLNEICLENEWNYIFDKKYGVLIFPRFTKRAGELK